MDALLNAATGGRQLGQEALASVRAFNYENAVEEAVCIVRHPMWEPLVADLRERYGWKVVLDRRDCTGATAADRRLLPAAERLAGGCDLVWEGADAWLDPELWEQIDHTYGLASIIIVSYNGLSFTRQCMESILQRTVYPCYEIVVIDNGSSSDVTDYLVEVEQRENRVRLVLNGTNRGFAAANNMGLQLAGGSDFLVLLNNDTVVPRGWLCRLLRHARRPDVGLVGPVTNWAGNEAGIDVSYGGLQDMPAFARSYVYAHEGQVFDIATLAMYCVAMRRSIAHEVGPLDERFGIGMFEDDDYSRRVRQAGYRVICAEDAFVHHYGMASFAMMGESRYRSLLKRNRRLYEKKWAGTCEF